MHGQHVAGRLGGVPHEQPVADERGVVPRLTGERRKPGPDHVSGRTAVHEHHVPRLRLDEQVVADPQHLPLLVPSPLPHPRAVREADALEDAVGEPVGMAVMNHDVGELRLQKAGPTLATDWQANPPREQWRREIGAGWSGFATCAGHAVTLEQRGDEEIVSCLSLADGTQRWAVPVRGRHQTVLGGVGPRSTPTIRDGVVYAAGATGWLHAIDGPSGRVKWRKNVLDDLGIDAEKHAAAVAWGRSGSPLVTDTLVIVPGGGPRESGGGAVSLVAYDRATGDRRWTGGAEQISYVSPDLATIGWEWPLSRTNQSRSETSAEKARISVMMLRTA